MRRYISQAEPEADNRAPELNAAEASMVAFIGTSEQREKARKRQGHARSIPKHQRQADIADVERRVRSQDWEGITPKTLVAVYWFCHTQVYGVEPVELISPAKWTQAARSAGTMINRYFDGDIQIAIVFMRWVWNRERSRAQWRREKDLEPKRITWVQQFCWATLVGDWRASLVRHVK